MIVKKILPFIKKVHKEGKPVLLGYSGGPDSSALFEALRKCRCEIHLVHIDHSWREKSRDEAAHLQKRAEELSIPFHLKTLSPPTDLRNAECRAREERYRFFKEVYDRIDAQALILAHQAEDLAETVMKRMFEAGHLFSLAPMKQVGYAHQMVIWRPLLTISKKEILTFNQKKQIPFFNDPTNLDEHFLRTRMRTQIFPFIEKTFGKNPTQGLGRLAAEVSELEEYFLRKAESFFEQLITTDEGFSLDCSLLLPIEPLEIEFVLKRLFAQRLITLSHEQFSFVIKALCQGLAKKKVEGKEWLLTVHRHRIVLNQTLPAIQVGNTFLLDSAKATV